MNFATKNWINLFFGLAILTSVQNAAADLKVGEQAVLFESIDENLEHLSMDDLTNGKPLVLVVSSCT
jgi:hypothetical protein